MLLKSYCYILLGMINVLLSYQKCSHSGIRDSSTVEALFRHKPLDLIPTPTKEQEKKILIFKRFILKMLHNFFYLKHQGMEWAKWRVETYMAKAWSLLNVVNGYRFKGVHFTILLLFTIDFFKYKVKEITFKHVSDKSLIRITDEFNILLWQAKYCKHEHLRNKYQSMYMFIHLNSLSVKHFTRSWDKY